MTAALVVIDMQQALCAGEEEAFDIARVLANVNGLVAQARNSGVPVVFVQHEEAEGSFRHGTPGWQLAPGLDTQAADAYVRKTACDSFHRTDLQDVLQRAGADRLVVCGLQTDFCVDTTVRRALALGYEVTLAEDAHSTLDNGVLGAAQIIAHHNRTLSHLTSFGPRVRVVPAANALGA